MGKTDIRDPAEVAGGIRACRTGRSTWSTPGPTGSGEMLAELLAVCSRPGVLRPLPVTTWDVRRAPEAFRFLARPSTSARSC